MGAGRWVWPRMFTGMCETWKGCVKSPWKNFKCFSICACIVTDSFLKSLKFSWPSLIDKNSDLSFSKVPNVTSNWNLRQQLSLEIEVEWKPNSLLCLSQRHKKTFSMLAHAGEANTCRNEIVQVSLRVN